MSTPQQGLQLVAPTSYNPEQSEINIDIVAVPGLGADPSKSFGSETPGGFNWLKNESEGIRSDVPSARVLLYQYESRWLGASAKQQTMYNVASLMLDSLVEQRKGTNEETRPLIFLAHSMGGLVVAKALTLAASHPEKIEYMRIFECFAGGIFFGTPFKGSSAEAKAYLLATLLEKFNKAIPSQLLQFLAPESESLDELRRDFISLAFKEPRSNIACIYEQIKTNYAQEEIFKLLKTNFFKAGPKEIVVTQDSASLDGAVIRGMACNHRQLNRFDSGKDGRYEVVRRQLKDIVKNAQLVVRTRLRASRQSVVDDATFQRLSQSLNVVDFQRKRRSIENFSGDSSWILQEQKYLQWSAQTETGRPPENPSLWVSGDEGLGKSKAAVSVIETLEKMEAKSNILGAKNVMVAYFLCDSTPDCSMAENMLKSLIWQLILKRRSLAQYVRTFAAAQSQTKGWAGGQGSEGQFSLSTLWKGLTEMIRDSSVQEVYFVINNLHYLSEDNSSTAEFQNILSELLLTNPSTVEDPIREKVKWMFLSRDRGNIKAMLHEDPESGNLRINLNDGSKSILRRQHLRSYIRDRVKSLALYKDYSLALQYLVFSSLEKRAESNSLWVEVVCRLLEGLPANFVTVRKTLELLPPDPEELIKRTWTEELAHPEKDGIETTKEILRTLVVAYEDPSLQELRVLAELDIDDDDADDATKTEQKILEQIRACGPLLRVYDTDSWDDTAGFQSVTRVSFIHPLAKDALLKPELRKYIGLAGGEDGETTEVKWQHGIVGLRCFSYMLNELGAVDDDSITLARTATTTEDQTENEIDELFPDADEDDAEDDGLDEDALEYPFKYWLRHGYDATPDFVDTLDIKHGFWSRESSARRRWWGSYAREEVDDELKNMTAMHIAAFFGLLPLVDSLLADGHGEEIHVLDSFDNQPLHWAAARGHIEVCERLLEKGADINNGRETRVWTPLHMAITQDRVDVVHLLLNNTRGEAADINAIAKEVGTPLSLALSWRQTKAAELLLKSGADPALAADDSEPPVAVAALQGFEDLLDKLLEAGGSRNITSHEYGSALAAAASAGNSNIVKRLLGLDNNPSSRQRALEEAASAGFQDVVNAILRSSARLPCDTAFENASLYGHDDVVQLLWSYHQHYNVLSHDAINNALYKATDAQQESTVTFLLQECSASPDAVGEEYGNALTASAFDGTVSILQTLIHYGANIDAPEGYPLQAAASNGHADVVQVLIDKGANVNALSNRTPPGTALQAACVAGNVDVARILLSHGANPNLGAGDLSNPLIAATSHGNGELLELLLQARANPNVFGGSDGSTPLINAAMTLPAKSLELMIRHGAVVDQKDPDEDTALIVSALYGDSDCVKVLLDHGAQINLGGKHNGTPLHAAASTGFTDTCRKLLQQGANVNMHSGPFYTVLQAAATSGDSECLGVILDQGTKMNVNEQGGEHFTALHAAAVQADDGCLRQLLARGAKFDIFPPPGRTNTKLGTPLQAAAFAGCNRNARLLLEAGADANIVSGKHGTALQAAALKCNSKLCEALLDHGARVDGWSGKYGSALVAAVARDGDDEDDQDRHDVLNVLLQQEKFPAKAYSAALEQALKLGRKEDFKLVLTSMKARASKNPKKFPNIKVMLAQFKKAQLSAHRAKRQSKDKDNRDDDDDDENSDFGEDVVNQYQDIDDAIEVEEDESAEEEVETDASAVPQQDRAIGGSGTSLPVQTSTTNTSRGIGNQDSNPVAYDPEVDQQTPEDEGGVGGDENQEYGGGEEQEEQEAKPEEEDHEEDHEEEHEVEPAEDHEEEHEEEPEEDHEEEHEEPEQEQDNEPEEEQNNEQEEEQDNEQEDEQDNEQEDEQDNEQEDEQDEEEEY